MKTILCKKYYKLGGKYVYGEYHPGVFYNKFILEKEIGDVSTNIADCKYIYVYRSDEKSGIRFRLQNDSEETYLGYFYDYFYDEKQIRKLKLKKLNKLWNI